MHDQEDKQYWVREGQKYETRFLKTIAPKIELDARLNPYTAVDYRAPDLLLNGRTPADLKTRRTPFFHAWPKGYDPQWACTVNCHKIELYAEYYPSTQILFWIDWQVPLREERGLDLTVEPMHGVWIASLRRILYLFEIEKAVIHRFSRRKNDKNHNAKASYLFDLRHLSVIWLETAPSSSPRF